MRITLFIICSLLERMCTPRNRSSYRARAQVKIIRSTLWAAGVQQRKEQKLHMFKATRLRNCVAQSGKITHADDITKACFYHLLKENKRIQINICIIMLIIARWPN